MHFLSYSQHEDNRVASSIKKVWVATGRHVRMTTVTWEIHYQLTLHLDAGHDLDNLHKSFCFATLSNVYKIYIFISLAVNKVPYV